MCLKFVPDFDKKETKEKNNAAETRPETQNTEHEQNLPSTVEAPTQASSRKGSKRTLDVEKTELEILKNIIEKCQQDDIDADRSFLLSLLPDLKRISEDHKLDLKTDMSFVVKKYKNQQNRYQNQAQQYGYYTQTPQPIPSQAFPCEYTNLESVSVSGHLREYNTERDYFAAGPSHEINATIPTPTPSPTLSTSHSLSDTSVIEDMFYGN
ncbi:unnamed protein product [Acanthoscelides obtectus]|uniref:BESS domain-containing protein n=1 Tax=Acanthoscelides obtectus TaxID=200917 RepID=A0A9P0L8U6_ACAOB|nr:unnamed protein product [Acanthoscelides obtectus]CAK1641506.1 hypothetical protein AOBTE_LOCUS12447 [Acanthoscelides obtectus]